MKIARIVVAVGFLAVAALAVGIVLHWTINRVYVPEGKSLRLRYKGPLVFGKRVEAKPGHFAQEGEILAEEVKSRRQAASVARQVTLESLGRCPVVRLSLGHVSQLLPCDT